LLYKNKKKPHAKGEKKAPKKPCGAEQKRKRKKPQKTTSFLQKRLFKTQNTSI